MKFFRVAGGNIFTFVRQIKELASAQFHWELKFPGEEKGTKGEVGTFFQITVLYKRRNTITTSSTTMLQFRNRISLLWVESKYNK